MRQSELEELARTFRDQGEGERARRLIRAWLVDRRKNRLSGSDAEGRILLAGSYDKMLADRETAGELLREALAIEPQSKTAVDAFLRLGFRKGDGGWYDPSAPKKNPDSHVNATVSSVRTKASVAVSLNNVDGKNLLKSYRTYNGQSALIPATGIDDYTNIIDYLKSLTAPPATTTPATPKQ